MAKADWAGAEQTLAGTGEDELDQHGRRVRQLRGRRTAPTS